MSRALQRAYRRYITVCVCMAAAAMDQPIQSRLSGADVVRVLDLRGELRRDVTYVNHGTHADRVETDRSLPLVALDVARHDEVSQFVHCVRVLHETVAHSGAVGRLGKRQEWQVWGG